MKRAVNLEDISDGKLYTSADLVKIDSHGCQGCSECCRDMGTSIILDPCDADRMTKGLSCSLETLIGQRKIELQVSDGVVLPNLAMDPQTNACSFLDAERRCSIHPYRTGVCRLFPLGRFYHGTREDGSVLDTGGFRYFVQSGACPRKGCSKVRIRKWLDLPDLPAYESFVLSWHRFLEWYRESLDHSDDDRNRNSNVFLLKTFYLQPYGNDFYGEYAGREALARQILSDEED